MMPTVKTQFGYTSDHQEVYRFTMTNKRGNRVSVLNYGCIIQEIAVKDQNGRPVDVVMGFDSPERYEKAGGFVGAVVGRVANRITGGHFPLNGRDCRLYQNDGENHLHGGKNGFSKKLWDYTEGEQELWLRYMSPDGEEGYPGNLFVTVHYTWSDEDVLLMEFSYVSDEDTAVGLTNHSYFDLNGAGSGKAMEQELRISADFYTPVDERGLVTGEIRKVDGTCFDFRSPHTLSESCRDTDPLLKATGGLDHNLILKGRNQAVLKGAETGICMEVDTDSPGMQLYSGNYLRENTGKNGERYGRRSGICLEPQYYPNSVNISHFPSPFVKRNEWRTFRTWYRFYAGQEENTNNQEG